MSTKQNQTIDSKTLLQNLKDLDDISQKIAKELDQKNKILRGGLKDCETCKTYIDNNRQRK